jgi:hypothetical protein
VVVKEGFTLCVPPLADSGIVLLSTLSEITTWVALLAVTVSMDELPCAIVVGLAAIATVGAFGVGVGVGIAALPPQEVRVEMATRAAATSHMDRQSLADRFRVLPEKRGLPKAVL